MCFRLSAVSVVGWTAADGVVFGLLTADPEVIDPVIWTSCPTCSPNFEVSP
jgi:hypothetical protein